jgi:hypothetical protein
MLYFVIIEIFKIVFHLILDVIFKLSYAVLTVMGIHCNDLFICSPPTIINSGYHEPSLSFTVDIQTKSLLYERSTAIVVKN